MKKASALAKDAFKAIYHWELLNWLRFDPWHKILLPDETPATSANEESEK
jgi:hypothetical protein